MRLECHRIFWANRQTVAYCFNSPSLQLILCILQYFYKVLRLSLCHKTAMHSHISCFEDLLRNFWASNIIGLGDGSDIFS